MESLLNREKKLYREKTRLEYQYLDLEKNAPVISRELSVDLTTIRYWMKKFSISARSHSVVMSLRQSNHVTLSKKLLEFLYGELLGDGHLGNNGPLSSFYSHSSKYLEYLVWLSGIFKGFGIAQVGKIHKNLKAGGFMYASRSYPELKTLRRKWYRLATEKERKQRRKFIKILPKNLKLTPLICRQWYIGDGSLNKDCGYTRLNTQCFTSGEVDRLIMLLINLDFKVTKHADRSIYISTYSTRDFLDFIGPCPKGIENIYGYKWNWQTAFRPGKLVECFKKR